MKRGEDILRRSDVLQETKDILESKFSYSIYAGEIVEGFKTPCFFIKLIKRKDSQTTNFTNNPLSIIITYFASSEKNKDIEYIDMIDDIELLFNTGFQVADRYLHINSIRDERIGEKQDILQITIEIEYLDSTNKKTNEEMGYIPATTLKTNMRLRAD